MVRDRALLLLALLVIGLTAPTVAAPAPWGFENRATTLVVHIVASTRQDCDRAARMERDLRDGLGVPRDRLRLFLWNLGDPSARDGLHETGLVAVAPRAGRLFVSIALRSGDGDRYEAPSSLSAADLLFSLGVFAQEFSRCYRGALLTFPVSGTTNRYRELLVRGDQAFRVPIATGASAPPNTRVTATARLDCRGLQALSVQAVGGTGRGRVTAGAEGEGRGLPSPSPRPTPEPDVTPEITQTYVQAFGRFPEPGEIEHWKPRYREVGGARGMMASLLSWLRSVEGTAERRQVVHRAYAVVKGRLATAAELKFCEDALLTYPALNYATLVQNLSAQSGR